MDGNKYEVLITKWRQLNVLVGASSNNGEMIADGPADPHDILRLQGVEALARYIVDEVQDVYRLQGVKINDKHIEVIVRQMLRGSKCAIRRPAIFSASKSNARVLDETIARPTGKAPATYEHVLLGITKASLSTDRSSRQHLSRKPPGS